MFIISEPEHLFVCFNVVLYLFLCELCVLNFIHFPTMLLVFFFFIPKSSFYIVRNIRCKCFAPGGHVCFDSLVVVSFALQKSI